VKNPLGGAGRDVDPVTAVGGAGRHQLAEKGRKTMPAPVFRPCKTTPGGHSIEAWTSDAEPASAESRKTEGTAMQQWEYRVADFTKLEGAVPELDRLGAEGWEAVGLVSRGARDGAWSIPSSCSSARAPSLPSKVPVMARHDGCRDVAAGAAGAGVMAAALLTPFSRGRRATSSPSASRWTAAC
jgi:hypothetical protein